MSAIHHTVLTALMQGWGDVAEVASRKQRGQEKLAGQAGGRATAGICSSVQERPPTAANPDMFQLLTRK
jgi:hypothetical protein